MCRVNRSIHVYTYLDGDGKRHGSMIIDRWIPFIKRQRRDANDHPFKRRNYHRRDRIKREDTRAGAREIGARVQKIEKRKRKGGKRKAEEIAARITMMQIVPRRFHVKCSLALIVSPFPLNWIESILFIEVFPDVFLPLCHP